MSCVMRPVSVVISHPPKQYKLVTWYFKRRFTSNHLSQLICHLFPFFRLLVEGVGGGVKREEGILDPRIPAFCMSVYKFCRTRFLSDFSPHLSSFQPNLYLLTWNYVNSMIIACSTCQREEKEWTWGEYLVYAVLTQFQFCCNLHNFFAKS